MRKAFSDKAAVAFLRDTEDDFHERNIATLLTNNKVEVFECCINGQEVFPGYTEQNDAIAQRDTLEHQAGGEQQKPDFLAALEYGMPPAGGIGIGIDRLRMMLLG